MCIIINKICLLKNFSILLIGFMFITRNGNCMDYNILDYGIYGEYYYINNSQNELTKSNTIKSRKVQ